ncbi:MAG: ribosomal protein L7/L12 [Chromatiales bacterium]|jgi:ribosomal protein L7/L12
MQNHSLTIPTDAMIALENGNKIEAIKHVRIAEGLGLKEAKELVELYIQQNPNVQSRLEAANAENAKNAFNWVLIFGAIATLVYFYLN